MDIEREKMSKTQVMIGVNESNIHGYPHPSISSHRAFWWTLHKIVSHNFSGFKLLLLHVQVPNEDGLDDTDRIYASPADFNDMIHRDRTRGLHLLEEFVGRCYEFGIECQAWIKKGDPKEVICQEAARVQPDFLVVGSRGLGTYQRLLVDSVSEFCAQHAECPVIKIKRNAEETPPNLVFD